MDSLRSVLFLALLCWFSGLGFSTLFGVVFGGRNGGPDGAKWWIRITGQFLKGFMKEVLGGVGRSFVNMIVFIHNSFCARFPIGTMVFYGVIVFLFLLRLFFK